MNAPRDLQKSAPPISRRGESLGTENAFVVLAEVNALVRQGRDIVSFCIGQPDFPTPVEYPGRRDRGDPRRQARLHAVRRHRRAACRGRHATWDAAAGSTFAPEDVVVGAGAKPFIAYAIASVTDHGAGDEVIYPVPGFPIYESQILANGALPVPIYLRESRDFAFDPNELEANITANTRLLILNTPHNPTGGILKRADLEAIAEILRRHPQIWIYADEIYSRLLYDGEFESLAALAGDARAHDHFRRRVEDLGDDRLAHRLHRQSHARAGVHALDHQHRFVRFADQPVGGGRGDQRAAGIGGRDARVVPRAPRPDRRTAQCGAGRDLQDARRRVLRVAQRHRRPASITGCADSEELRKRLLNEAGVAVLADIHFGRRVPGDGQHIRFSYAASPAMPFARASSASPLHQDRIGNERRRVARGTTIERGARRDPRSRARGAGQDRRRRRRACADARKYIDAHAQGPRPRIERGPASDGSCSAQPTWRAPSNRFARSAGDSRRGRALRQRARPAPGARRAEVAARRLLAGIRRPRLGRRRAGDRSAPDARRRPSRHHRRVLRDRRDGHAGHAGRAPTRRRRRPCCPTRTSPCCRPIASWPAWKRRSR